MLVAAVVASSVDGSTRWRCGSEQWRERESLERGERCKGLRGVRGALGCLQRRAGKHEVVGVWSRAPGTRPSSSWQKEEDYRVVEMGWAARHSVGLQEHQVRKPR